MAMGGALFFLHLYFSTLTAQLGDGLFMAEHMNAFNAPIACAQVQDEVLKPSGCSRWTYFAAGSLGYGQAGDPDSHLENGMIGVSGKITDDFMIGIAGTMAHSDDALSPAGTESQTDTNGGAVLAAYTPASGFRLYVTGVAEKLNLSTTRAYDNGGSTDYSHGSTDALALGAAGQVGWAYAATERNTFMPYIEYRWSSATINAFTEHDGSAPADFTGGSLSASQVRFGVSDAQRVSDNLVLTGSLALGARIDSGKNTFADSAGALTEDQGLNAGHRDWVDMSLATDWRVSDGVVLQGRLGGHTATTGDPTVTANLGATLNF